MNSKDKPKRGEAKTFVREIKPKAEGSTASKSGGKPGFKSSGKPGAKFSDKPAGAAKPRAKAEGAVRKPVRSAKREEFVGEGASAPTDGKPERISKILARVGVASRRDVERMILEGRVTLNGKPLASDLGGSRADHGNFGMGGNVVFGSGAVA